MNEQSISHIHNRASILNGDQLSHIHTLISDHASGRGDDFGQLRADVTIGYNIMSTLEGFPVAVRGAFEDSVPRDKNNAPTFKFEDIEPGAWQETDPDVSKKIALWVQTLSDALELCRNTK